MKSSRTPPFLKRSLFALGFMLVLLGVTGCCFVVNTTRSFPLGVYFKTHSPVHKGDLVLFCPEENMVARYGRARGLISYGVCPGRYGYLIKRVMATEGDEVNLSDAGGSVNGIAFPTASGKKPFPLFRARWSCIIRFCSCLNTHSLSTAATSASSGLKKYVRL